MGGGTRVWVSSWVVKSNTQSPSLVTERKKNIENVTTCRLSTGDAIVMSLERIVSDVVCIATDAGDSCHSARTTGTWRMLVD